MVIEAKSIKGSSKGLHYQADDKGMSKEILRSNFLIGDEPKDWNQQMQETESKNRRVENKRFSIVIAPSKDVSKTLTDNDWKSLALSYFEKMGIDINDHQFIAHLHTSTDDPHLHITLSRIPLSDERLKYNAINDNQIGIKSGTIADKIAKENGWRTAKEISSHKKESIAISLRTVLKSARNFTELSNMMEYHGFSIKLSENEAKGIYGMRIIPMEDININPSERALQSRQGYKLSDIERQPGRKAKFRIADVKTSLERNLFKTLSPQEKIAYVNSKTDKLFNTEEKRYSDNYINEKQFNNNATDSLQSSSSLVFNPSNKNVPNEKGVLEQLLQSNHVPVSPDDDLLKKKKKKKR